MAKQDPAAVRLAGGGKAYAKKHTMNNGKSRPVRPPRPTGAEEQQKEPVPKVAPNTGE